MPSLSAMGALVTDVALAGPAVQPRPTILPGRPLAV